MPVSVTYRLVGSGWAECDVIIDDQLASMTASYLSDALGSLLEAAIRLMRGASDASAFFAEEPGEYRWLFTRIGEDRVRVRILAFDDWNDQPEARGTLRLDAECRLRTFTGAVLAASQQVLREFGAEEYLRHWSTFPFPVEAQAELKRLLTG